jgi:hypothetical protein
MDLEMKSTLHIVRRKLAMTILDEKSGIIIADRKSINKSPVEHDSKLRLPS